MGVTSGFVCFLVLIATVLPSHSGSTCTYPISTQQTFDVPSISNLVIRNYIGGDINVISGASLGISVMLEGESQELLGKVQAGFVGNSFEVRMSSLSSVEISQANTLHVISSWICTTLFFAMLLVGQDSKGNKQHHACALQHKSSPSHSISHTSWCS